MTSLREVRNVLTWQFGHPTHLFLHIPKNAGVSLRKHPGLQGRILPADPWLLQSRAYVRALRATMDANGEHHGYQHARWRDVAPKVTARLRAFAVVRNPWARTVSRWRFGRLAVEQGNSPAGYCAETFEGFLEERHVWGGRPFYWHRAIRGWYPQFDYVTDADGAIRADVLRLEHLDQDLTAYLGTAPPPRRNTSGRFDWRAVYTPQTIQIVADWYAADIDAFGFDFDTAATRNFWVPT
ncbi:sulfotransferase domain-containing protein [Rhodobacter sp. Har01]|uniref:sulfotransferase family 2 domain-containing protein n=1 Tax=Rhodobacter sp. Har01 TaxID=2883999 RepID=UPI001D066B1F|nr:sulfotransferase family 2 domain-containing protein [Rhodobacter sp. Har01]MCB6178827.1 sulfotransferase domain-containing protein [Rhodobacter sp. Har01]